MNSIFKQFTAYSQIFEEQEKETCNLIQIFTELFEELYKFMGYAYTIFNNSENAIKCILHELLIMENLRQFDKNTLREINASVQKLSEVKEIYENENKCIYSEAIGFKGKVKEERKRLEDNKHDIDELESPNYADILSIFAKEVAQELNPSQIKRVDNLSESLKTINRNIDELLKMTFNLQQTIDKSITDIENYTVSVKRLLKEKEKNQKKSINRLFRRLFFQEDARVVLLALLMIPESKEIQENCQELKEQALQNKKELADILIRIKPRGLMNKGKQI